jgi:hypothetical protein
MKTKNFNPLYCSKIESNQKFGKILNFRSFPNNAKILERIKAENLSEISVFVYEKIRILTGSIIDIIGFSNEDFSKDLQKVFLAQGYKNQVIRCSKLTMYKEDYENFSDFVEKNRIFPKSTEDEIFLKFNAKIEVLEQEAILDLYDIY